MFGFAGEIASGKGTGTRLLKEWYPGTPSVRFSDPLREFLRGFNEMKARDQFCMAPAESLVSRHVEEVLPGIFPKEIVERGDREGVTDFVRWLSKEWFARPEPVKEDRHNLQALSTAVRSMFAENILEQTVIARIRSRETESPLAIIEGIRRVVDIGTLLVTPEFRLVYVEIDPVVAHQRMVKRNENVGDAEMSFERFMELRNAEAEQQIRLLKPHAHLVIDNSGPLEVFEGVLRAKAAEWVAS